MRERARAARRAALERLDDALGRVLDLEFDDAPLLGDELAQHHRVGDVIVDAQHAQRIGRHAEALASLRVNQNVEPSSGALRTPIVPPCSSTIRSQTASPIPVPGYSFLACRR